MGTSLPETPDAVTERRSGAGKRHIDVHQHAQCRGVHVHRRTHLVYSTNTRHEDTATKRTPLTCPDIGEFAQKWDVSRCPQECSAIAFLSVACPPWQVVSVVYFPVIFRGHMFSLPACAWVAEKMSALTDLASCRGRGSSCRVSACLVSSAKESSGGLSGDGRCRASTGGDSWKRSAPQSRPAEPLAQASLERETVFPATPPLTLLVNVDGFPWVIDETWSRGPSN